ncbi:MAG: fluoride efflux transporter CrcB [Candidatus Omnitrophica bacterium CG11_big_fil_rev_8_21_14_0_20_43_6]|nr:MAG: fluoride efflux transporter CrcB [Candidatus Omnitrophica bacterium CG11_big_fil_rev_8_21_14_0_20_43_6]
MNIMMKLLNLIIGGAAGTVARYLLGGAVYRVLGTSFPYGTLVVNVSGCFILGILASLANKKFMLNPDARLLLMIGFCGAFTTFSTLIFESDNLLKNGQAMRAFSNIFVSVILGFLLFRLGSLLGEVL